MRLIISAVATSSADSSTNTTQPEFANPTRLAGGRKTNPEFAAELFLSQKTVETHLHQAAIPGARLTLYRGEGHRIFFSHAAEILSALAVWEGGANASEGALIEAGVIQAMGFRYVGEQRALVHRS